MNIVSTILQKFRKEGIVRLIRVESGRYIYSKIPKGYTGKIIEPSIHRNTSDKLYSWDFVPQITTVNKIWNAIREMGNPIQEQIEFFTGLGSSTVKRYLKVLVVLGSVDTNSLTYWITGKLLPDEISDYFSVFNSKYSKMIKSKNCLRRSPKNIILHVISETGGDVTLEKIRNITRLPEDVIRTQLSDLEFSKQVVYADVIAGQPIYKLGANYGKTNS